MLTLALPIGNTFGWGVCGRYLTRELARLTPARLVTEPFDADAAGGELEFAALARLAGEPAQQPSPVLQAITGADLLPWRPGLRGQPTVGYTFFEHSALPEGSVRNAKANFDRIVAGSSWCRDVLRAHGVEDAGVIVQGVDHSVFNMYENHKALFEDRFVVYSGGKLEFRKGQDLVIRAFQVFQQRHDDVLLVNSWANPWAASRNTMAGSPYIRWQFPEGDHCAGVNALLAANGVDLSRVITLPAKPNALMAAVYRNSDCGLFPNRCEGGTNLALMEYMACGKPAIASWSSGHRDVVSDETAIVLRRMRQVEVPLPGATAVWDDPDLEEVVAALEHAYQRRDDLAELGSAAGTAMQEFSWEAAARRFHELLVP